MINRSKQLLAGIIVLTSAISVGHAALVGTPGDLYVSGQASGLIYEVNPTTGAIVGSVSANGGDTLGITFDSAGNLYAVDFSAGSLEKYNGTTGALIGPVASGIGDPYGVTIAGRLFYVSNSDQEKVEAFNSSGTVVHTITTSDFSNFPLGMVVSPGGRLLVGTRNGTSIDSFNLDGTGESTFASNSAIGDGFGLAYGLNGNLYETNAVSNSVLELNPTTGALITSITGGGLNEPLGLAFGPNGDLYVGNGNSSTISVFNGTTGAPITTFTGFNGVFGVAFDPANVPEPSSLSILAVVAAGLLVRSRRELGN